MNVIRHLLNEHEKMGALFNQYISSLRSGAVRPGGSQSLCDQAQRLAQRV